MKNISLKINNKKINAQSGQSILEIAQKNKIDIPTLCYHSDLKPGASCRLCVVEIKGYDELKTACSTQAQDGMEILTESTKVKKARQTNLELIFAQHEEECHDCVYGYNCHLLALAKKFKVDITRFKDRKTNFPVYKFGPALIFDSSKCIDCGNCVAVCKQQGVNFLEIKKHGQQHQVEPTCDPSKDCIYCGQCLVHCPVGAFEAVGEFENIEKPLQQKNKTVVFQFAPAIRSSIGEEFNLPYGKILTEQIVAGIKKLGVDYVFDTCVGADFTTYEEAQELLDKVKNKEGVCLSSCCPAWVKFLEFNYPEFIPHIATTRSPQIILGGIIKTYWAEKNKIKPQDIVVVSVMPCTAKKYEIKRPELKINNLFPVDYVLTTRELAYLFKKRNIDLTKLKSQSADNPLGEPSGAGVIYGASGGVMESALRTAYFKATGQQPPQIDFKKVRGQEGIKKATVKIGQTKIKMAAANGIGNAIKILEELKKDPQAYAGVEVMACPGGCIGGGGQPVPSDAQTRQARAESLYKIDKNKKLKFAHENPVVKQVYRDFLISEKKIHSICHTHYKTKKREVKLK
ncbi:MAG: [FeFe] hydrogenase, group A [Patescibacteria group bacterium]|nr:[FeFe] hydrogenase, group A [Patescibacteria group bacterium]